MTELKYFGHIHLFSFHILMDLFHLYFFGRIHRFFGQVQQLIFVSVIFWSCSTVHVNFVRSYSNPFLVILNRSK